jgi:hypothetical protein
MSDVVICGTMSNTISTRSIGEVATAAVLLKDMQKLVGGRYSQYTHELFTSPEESFPCQQIQSSANICYVSCHIAYEF